MAELGLGERAGLVARIMAVSAFTPADLAGSTVEQLRDMLASIEGERARYGAMGLEDEAA